LLNSAGGIDEVRFFLSRSRSALTASHKAIICSTKTWATSCLEHDPLLNVSRVWSSLCHQADSPTSLRSMPLYDRPMHVGS
jgi:hypothetical protein